VRRLDEPLGADIPQDRMGCQPWIDLLGQLTEGRGDVMGWLRRVIDRELKRFGGATDMSETVIDPQAPSSVVQGIVNAYYPKVVTSPDSARNRAQAGFGIASAIATALIGLGVFTDVRDFPWFVKLFGLVALAAWLLAAGFYTSAVAAPVQQPDLMDSPTTFDFANGVIAGAMSERGRVDAWQDRARRLAAAAAVLTLLTVILAVSVKPEQESFSAEVIVSSSALEGLQKACDSRPTRVLGDVESESLATDVIVVRLDDGLCRKDSRDVSFRFRRADVVGIVSR
jgi:hypothetical protein